MQILASIEALEPLPPTLNKPSVVTIGNFDGCHRGHQQLIASTRHFQKQEGYQAIALSFNPRPEAFFRGLTAEKTLFTPALKVQAFRELGFDAILIQNFDAAFSQISHQEFLTKILLQYLNAKAVVVGDNFQFGYRRQGDAAWLAQASQASGLQVKITPAFTWNGTAASSTRIRTLLAAAQVEEAQALLGRPYLLSGSIVRGDQLGRQLDVPTANLELESQQLLPAHGVYAGYVWLACRSQLPNFRIFPPYEELIPAVFNLGLRPSIAQTEPALRLEAHLLSGHYQADELYGVKAAYYFSHFLRPEQRFASLELLKQQLQEDIQQGKAKLQL